MLVAIARDENRYVEEWVRHHIDIGFDRIQLYDNCSQVSLQNDIDQLPETYRSQVRVELEPVSSNPQMACYQKAMHRYWSRADWIAYIDLDEFIQVDKPLGRVLELPKDVGSLLMPWYCYTANGQERYEPKPVVERFTRCYGWDPSNPYNVKPIARPRATKIATFHRPILFPGFHELRVSDNIRVNHYYTKSYEEWLWKMERGSPDTRWSQRYNAFFKFNPDLMHLYDPAMAQMRQGHQHRGLQRDSSIKALS